MTQFIVTLFDDYGYLLIEAEDKESAIDYLKQVTSSSKMYQDLQDIHYVIPLDVQLKEDRFFMFEVKDNPSLELQVKVQGLLTKESLEKRCIEFVKRHIDENNEALKGFCNTYNIHKIEGQRYWDISSDYDVLKGFVHSQQHPWGVDGRYPPRVTVDGGTEKALRVHTIYMYRDEPTGITYNAYTYFWIPKKLVSNWRKNSEGVWSVEIPIWFYDKKLDECVEKKTQYLYEIRK